MVLKRLKLHQFLNGVPRTFSYTQASVSEGGRNLKISAKKAVFLVSSDENQISPLWSPSIELLEKFTSGPPGKILPTPMHTSM